MHAMTVDVAVSGQEQNSTTSDTIAGPGLAARMLFGEERDDLLEARRPCAEGELLSRRCGRSLRS